MGVSPDYESLPNFSDSPVRGDRDITRETRVVHGGLTIVSPPTDQRKLIVDLHLRLKDGSTKILRALIDTGAEISLIRKGLLSAHYYRPSAHPKRFVAANQAVLEGGWVEIECKAVLKGHDIDTGLEGEVECPTIFYDANISVDAILSYDWMAKNLVDVRCVRHGLEIGGPRGPLWIPGVVYPPMGSAGNVRVH